MGALAASRKGQSSVIAVCDVGGGSSQVAVGTRRDGVAWVRSVDIGSMRLTSRLLEDDPPGDAAIERARAEVNRLLDGFVPPAPEVALAVGGSARAIRSIVGGDLGPDELDEVAGDSRADSRGGDRPALRRPPRARADARGRRCDPGGASGAAPRPAARRARRRRPRRALRSSSRPVGQPRSFAVTEAA